MSQVLNLEDRFLRNGILNPLADPGIVKFFYDDILDSALNCIHNYLGFELSDPNSRVRHSLQQSLYYSNLLFRHQKLKLNRFSWRDQSAVKSFDYSQEIQLRDTFLINDLINSFPNLGLGIHEVSDICLQNYVQCFWDFLHGGVNDLGFPSIDEARNRLVRSEKITRAMIDFMELAKLAQEKKILFYFTGSNNPESLKCDFLISVYSYSTT